MIDRELETIIQSFKKISTIPRCSKHEEKIAQYLVDWADKKGFKYKKDLYNNVLINIPPSPGYEKKDSIALQGHMDMVCEKTKESKHDFSKDPIDVIEDGDWLKANGTTLGGDDGVALAVGMALAEDKNTKHPHLELLFTADEETGMNGARNLSNGFFKSKKLINIDSEREGVFTIGCAGGEDTDIKLLINKIEEDGYFYEIDISGLLSGHSGVEINKNRANSIKLMSDIVEMLQNKKITLCSIDGGSARNAIPKHSTAVICSKKEVTNKDIESFYEHVMEKYPDEKSLKIELRQTEKTYAISESNTIFKLIKEIPHGVYESLENGTTKTSNNFAKISTLGDRIEISTNQRSLTEEGLDLITKTIENIAKRYGAEYSSYNRYPAWQPNYNSELLKKSIEVYENLFLQKPVVEVIHAGLECGIIGSKNHGIDMISIGPTMQEIHTPNERLYVPSLKKIWQFITELLKKV